MRSGQKLQCAAGRWADFIHGPGAEHLLNFHRERWGNVLRELCEYRFEGEDFELRHYSLKGSERAHLRQLHALLEAHSKKNYWMYCDEEGRCAFRRRARAGGK